MTQPAAVPPAAEEFRRVHRLTPLLRFWTLILAVFAALIFNFNISTLNSLWGFFSGEFSQAWVSLLIGVGGLVLAFVLIWWVSQIWWKATGFRITDEEVQLKRGVLNTQLRTARYDRVQAVDVVESVIARIFRVAAVRVETAGGGNSVIEIAYLRKAEAEQLRQELLAYTRGPAVAEVPVSEISGLDVSPVPGEPKSDVLVPEIPIQRSLLGALLSIPAIISAVGIIILLLTPIAPASALPVLVGVLPIVWGQIDRSWKFNARLEGEVVHLSYGLADRRRQSIPLHRIHGVKIRQPLLWRFIGWWAVDVTVAGYGQESDKKTGTSTLFPVGSREQAVAVAAVLGPLSLAEIEEQARPEGPTHPDFSSPRIARWVSPIDRKQQGVTLLDHAVIVHKGRLSRRVSMIEPSHIQEVTLSHGPLQQLVNLCTVRMDLVAGPVRMAGEDLNAAKGRELVDWLQRRKLPELELRS
ncbi:PH domain-containing protein [Corynebacterium sp. A21]|uniref:PH domain-containing protein n=1 Tax=Corynebacterium sp. A21 TaxID=3457318 RepID=UPI003FD0524C